MCQHESAGLVALHAVFEKEKSMKYQAIFTAEGNEGEEIVTREFTIRYSHSLGKKLNDLLQELQEEQEAGGGEFPKLISVIRL